LGGRQNDQKINKYSAKMEHNNSFNLYIISEIFSKYPEIASSWKQTGKLPYKLTSNIKQNCQLAICRKEFYNYLLSLLSQRDDVTCPVLFSMCDNNNDINSIEYTFDKSRFYRGSSGDPIRTFWVQVRSHADLTTNFYLRWNGGFHINEDELLSEDNEGKEYYWKYIHKSFRDESQRVFFDIVTTYNILKLRETCYDVIPNYAKVKVLEQFNNVLDFLLNKHIRFYSFYVSLNARILNIDISKIINEFPNSSDHLKEIASKITSIINSW
jgi:hypothetical protein